MKTLELNNELAVLKANAITNDAVLDKMNESNLSKILFPVEKVKTTDLLPSYNTISEYSHMVIGNINGQKTVLNACSDRYELVDNSSIFPVLTSLLLNANIDFSTHANINAEKTQFTVDFRIKNNPIKMDNNDLIFPQITVTHSYDGKLQYAVLFGYFRMICSNGMVIPYKGTEHLNLHIKGKHTTSILMSFDTLIEKVNTFINRKEELLNPYVNLQANKVVNVQSRINDVFEKTGIKNPADKAMNHILQRIDFEKNDLGLTQVNDWLIYNGFNHYINNTNKKNFEVRTQLDQKVLNTLLVTA